MSTQNITQAKSLNKNIFNWILRLAIASVVLLALCAYACVYTIGPGEVAVVTTGGRFSESQGVIEEQGPHFRWPAPVQRVVKVSRAIKVLDVDAGREVTTADGMNLLASMNVAWRVANPADYFIRLEGNKIKAEEALDTIAREARNRVMRRYNMSQLVQLQGSQLFDLSKDIAEEMNQSLGIQESSPYGDYGIQVDCVTLSRLVPPSAILDQQTQSLAATRQNEANRLLSASQENANQVVAQAEAARDIIVSLAEVEAQRILADGQREAGEILSKVETNESLAILLREVEAIEKIFGASNVTVIIDSQSDGMLGQLARRLLEQESAEEVAP